METQSGELPAPAPSPPKSGRRVSAGKAAVDRISRYATDIVLKNGSTLHLRAVEQEDALALLEFSKRLSRESLYLRFFSASSFDLAKAQYIARVDYENQFALVGETCEGIVALGHFYRDPKAPDRAEVAFAVADFLQGQGIGTSLLEQLARIAREKGITTFVAETLPYNHRMIQVFLDSGFDVKKKAEDGALLFEISLASTEAAEEKSAARARQAATASRI